ncbi:calcium/sodium antiporter [Phenylobacterium sp.]|uniref:calcium/sodium antiporter n=1 Tax=Phenylobacterium sp. TaxID=1871053 RepID=UPI0027308A19|nr:calcium/sodium antiporter [Phenylobacterium sp.]MDP1617693.1 calcium/sodium antiporter [Phenylobacterium sp.]MDP1986678.1 calcium/sodium antiporter [Phenylobacterium sp.]
MIISLLIIGGLVFLAFGGEILVRGAVGSARVLGVSPLLSGLVLVGFGTSTPELVTSLIAALRNAPDIAVGNVVGSNIANILLILGVTAAISPIYVRPQAIGRDMIALGASSVICLLAVVAGFIDRWFGLFLLVLLGIYLVVTYLRERNHEAGGVTRPPVERDWKRLGRFVLMTAGGIVLTVVGARLLVGGAIELAEGLGMPQRVIGLTIVAVGTSLPELVACVVAALRRHADVALGNVIGSNIYNVFGILGITAAVSPIRIPPEIANLDIWVLLAATGLLALLLRTGGGLKRLEGAGFLLAYVAYVGLLLLG